VRLVHRPGPDRTNKYQFHRRSPRYNRPSLPTPPTVHVSTTTPVCPSCQRVACVFACAVGQITSTFPRVPCPSRGAFARSSRTLGAGCGGRGGGARRVQLKRTAKSCGPDAPTLVSSSREAKLLGDDGGKQARSPRRARRKPLKPSRRECRVFPV
jgi:hypothetical protein